VYVLVVVAALLGFKALAVPKPTSNMATATAAMIMRWLRIV
jgi:hypothetical protein